MDKGYIHSKLCWLPGLVILNVTSVRRTTLFVCVWVEVLDLFSLGLHNYLAQFKIIIWIKIISQCSLLTSHGTPTAVITTIIIIKRQKHAGVDIHPCEGISAFCYFVSYIISYYTLQHLRHDKRQDQQPLHHYPNTAWMSLRAPLEFHKVYW